MPTEIESPDIRKETLSGPRTIRSCEEIVQMIKYNLTCCAPCAVRAVDIPRIFSRIENRARGNQPVTGLNEENQDGFALFLSEPEACLYQKVHLEDS